MMEKLFIDTNLIVDIVEERKDAPLARQILQYSKREDFVHIYASYLSFANTAYIIRKRPSIEIKEEILALMKHINVISSGDMQLLRASQCQSPDFEDALQIACAESKNCDVIITRNPEHFRSYTEIPVVTPEDFVSHCKQS